MNAVRVALLSFGALLTSTLPARADDAADARKLVEKAIQAHGGDKLARFPASTAKMKGTVHVMGQAVDFTGEILTDGAERQKVDLEASVAGQKFRIVNVLNGNKGWARVADMLTEFDKDMLAEAREQAHANWVITLAPLKDKAFTLATIGEVKIEKRTAVGVKVSHKGRRDVDLYFDKETGVLAKTEKRVKDEGTGQEVTEEAFYDGYKDFQGTKQPTKFTVKRDGKLFLEGEATEYELSEKLDASNFAKP